MNMENDYADEHQAFAASRSTDYVYETGNRAVFHALDSHAETIEGAVSYTHLTLPTTPYV